MTNGDHDAAVTRRVAYAILAVAFFVIAGAYVTLALFDEQSPPDLLGNLAAAVVGAIIALAARDRSP